MFILVKILDSQIQVRLNFDSLYYSFTITGI
jgi:hypothetical protein